MADAYLYSRVSHRTSAAGDSIDDQVFRQQEYAATRIRPKPERVVVASDEAVSAYTKRFMTRQGVLRIINNIRSGDHFVVDRFDRSWRSVQDFLNTAEWMKEHDITLHIVDFRGQSIDMGDPHTRFYMTSLANHAELESDLKSVRLKDMMTQKRRRGEKCGHSPPLGMRFTHRMINGEGRWFVEWDARSRGVMQEIHLLRDKCGIGFNRIARLMNIYQFKYQERGTMEEIEQKLAAKHIKKPWSLHRVRRWYLRERFYRELEAKGITDVRDVSEAVRNLEAYHSRDAKGQYNLTDASRLAPELNLESSLPDWVKELGCEICTEETRRKSFEASGVISEYMKAYRANRPEPDYRQFHVDDCPMCGSKAYCTTVAEDPYCYNNDDVACEKCDYVGFMVVPEDGAEAHVRWADLGEAC